MLTEAWRGSRRVTSCWQLMPRLEFVVGTPFACTANPVSPSRIFLTSACKSEYSMSQTGAGLPTLGLRFVRALFDTDICESACLPHKDRRRNFEGACHVDRRTMRHQ